MSLTNLAKAVVEHLNGQAKRGYQVASMYRKEGNKETSRSWVEGSDLLAGKANRIKAWLESRPTQRAVIHHF